MRFARSLNELADGVLEVLYPERCVVCGRGRDAAMWSPGGAEPAPGFGIRQATHLCTECHAGWLREPVVGQVLDLPLYSAMWESEKLVQAVGAWKYRGLRGLARPLAALLVPSLAMVPGGAGLVPVPLHRRRRRERGFDQCRLLADLAGPRAGIPVLDGILVRRRATAQQASCSATGDARSRNVAGVFAAREPDPGGARDLVVLDDLATTGATLAAAVEALRDAGWRVRALVALGQARRLGEGRG